MSDYTAFDKVADKFWQEYQNGTPIGGGMAFETQVRACQLDETTDSLKQLDRLLSAIKEKITSDEQTLLAQKAFRNFLLFIGFYVGRVVVNYRPKINFHWQSFDDLKDSYQLSEQDKFYKMSALCPDVGKPFFVWLTLGASLFGDDNRKFSQPMTGAMVPQSVYWAVQAYLDELSLVEKPPKPSPATIQAPQNQAVQNQTPQNQVGNQIAFKPSTTSQIGKVSSQPNKSNKNKSLPKKDPFDEIKADLVHLPAINAIHDEQYQKANNFLIQADKAVQDGTALDDRQQANLAQAFALLEKLAQMGNSNAMLSLAIYQFEGRLTKEETSKAVAWVQQAAEAGDMRAQKLLSRLYYQGLGVKISTEMGNLWLDRAAQGGHKEAKALKAQMNMVKMMKNDYKSEVQQDKRMYVMLSVVAVVFVFLMWLGAKFMAK